MGRKHGILSALLICIKYAKIPTVANIVLNIISGLQAPIMVIVVGSFLNAALALTESEPQYGVLLFSAAMILVIRMASQILQVIKQYLEKSITVQLSLNLKPELIKKKASLNFEEFEDENTLDLATRVVNYSESKFGGVMADFNSLLFTAVKITGILTILFLHQWKLAIVFALITLPAAVLSFKGGRAVYGMDRQTTMLTRVMSYLSDILINRETAAERVLYGFSPYVNDRFCKAHLKRSNMNTVLLARWSARVKLCKICVNGFVVISMFVLLSQIHGAGLSSGMYIAIIGAMINLSTVMSGSLSRALFNFAGHFEYLRDYSKFMAMEGSEDVLSCERVPVTFESLEIRDLCFKYKSSGDYVLKGVNMKIEKGKSYSLIGHNGAGKTTLIKIITGLYRSFEGFVTINGKDIGEYSISELHSMFGIVYQDYAKYYISLKDNVTFGNYSEKFREAAEFAELGSVIDNLKNGCDTYLGKIFDGGVDISGGEWQKIAIARALYKQSPFLILDEPTASLSPMTESKVYQKFSDISKGKTLLLISHRLGSTKIADNLFVLDNGIIAEEGTHEQLMAKDGLYAGMFESQRSWYIEDTQAD